jgi:hypothetical protein
MAISKQSNHCNLPVGQALPKNGIAQQHASDLFEDSERMFGFFNLMNANVCVRISQHEIVKVTVTLSDTFPLPRRRNRGRTVPEPIMQVRAMSAHESEFSQRPIDMTKIFKRQFTRLLRHSAIDHGEWTFILESGKVRRIVPAPSIMNKNEEIPLLARFFSCCERPA